MTYLLPTSLDSALSALAQVDSRNPTTIIAGATDYFPALGTNLDHGSIIDITRLEKLRQVELADGFWRIGALSTWTDIINADLPKSFAGLQQAATQIGGVQIQNVATVVGNICNASPAADGVPPLLSLEASVELRSVDSTRVVMLSEFVLGNRSTTRRPDELVTAILIPDTAKTPHSADTASLATAAPSDTKTIGSFVKLGSRSYLVISIVMVAAVAEIDRDGTIRSAKICVGACSEVAQRLPKLEQDLIGVPLDHLDTFEITSEHLAPLSPIDDVRATATYRMQVTPNLIVRTLRGCDEVTA